MRKPAFGICENKDADQLRGNREADQRLCFRHTDSTIPHLSKSEISSISPSSVAAQPGLCRTLSETPKTCFLTTRLISRDFKFERSLLLSVLRRCFCRYSYFTCFGAYVVLPILLSVFINTINVSLI